MKKSDLIEVIRKEAKIKYYKPKGRNVGHYFVQIPQEVVRELEIKKGNKLIIEIPLKDKNKYSIKIKR